MNIQETIAPLGHTIIALSTAPALGLESLEWAQYLNDVSGPIEQRPAILIVPFSDIDQAQAFAEQAPVKTNYRIGITSYIGTGVFEIVNYKDYNRRIEIELVNNDQAETNILLKESEYNTNESLFINGSKVVFCLT